MIPYDFTMRLMFKYKFNSDNLVNRDCKIITRSQMGPIFAIEMPNSQRFSNSTTYLLRSEWNNLPLSLGSIDDYAHFSFAVKRYYKDNYLALGKIDPSAVDLEMIH